MLATRHNQIAKLTACVNYATNPTPKRSSLSTHVCAKSSIQHAKKDVIMVRKIYQTTQAIARYFIKLFVKKPSYKLV